MRRFLSASHAAPVLAFALIALCLETGLASAQVPHDIEYKGRLTDSVGAPLSGPVSLSMRIYDVIAGGFPLYAEDHPNVVVDDLGAFSVKLGAGSAVLGAFDPSLFSGVNRYIEVVVGGDVLAPRQALGSVPWALVAEDVFFDPTNNIGTAINDAQSTADSALSAAGTAAAGHTVDTTLNQSEVDAFVSNNGYSTGAHTTDTNTQLSNAQVLASELSNGNTIEAEFAVLQLQVNSLVAAVIALENSQNSGGGYVIPYEPWNPSIVVAPLMFEKKAYWMSFHAPSTGSYTNATIKTSNGQFSANQNFHGPIQVGIYSNAEISPPETLLNGGISNIVQNIPLAKLGDSTLNFPAATDIRGYIEFEFAAPIHLEEDKMYWFALSHNSGVAPVLYIDFHLDHNLFSGTVLEQAAPDLNAELPGLASKSNLLFSERAFWFRVYAAAP